MAKKSDQIDYKLIDNLRTQGLKNWQNFIQKYLFINDKDGNRIPLRFTPSQARIAAVRDMYLKANEPCWLLVLKGRQRGVSTLSQAMVFTETYCGENQNALVMTHLKEVTAELLDKAKLFYKCLPESVKMPLAKSNEYVFQWDHNTSKITLATAGNADVTHGRTLRKVHLSEISRYPDLYQMLKGMKAIPNSPGVLVIAESTAYGADNMMYDLWQEAMAKKNKWNPIFLRWQDDEDCKKVFGSEREKDAFLEKIFGEYPNLKTRMKEYQCTGEQIAWYYDQLIESLGDESYCAQEFPMDPEEAFITSGTPFFPGDITQQFRLMAMNNPGRLYDPRITFRTMSDLERDCKAPSINRTRETYLEMWAPPVPGVKYLVVADSAEGIQGRDPCAVYVMDICTQNIVAELHGIIEPHPLKDMCIALANLYNKALIVPEAHGAGSALCALLKDSQYQPIYYKRKMINGVLTVTNEIGWDTNPATRPMLFAEMLRIYRARKGDKHFVPSLMLMDEIRTFVIQSMTGAGRAQKGAHDDRVMAWAIGVYVCLQYMGMSNTGISTVSNMAARQAPTNPGVQDMLAMMNSSNWTGQSFDDFYSDNSMSNVFLRSD